jgi:hypothetical protein
MYLTKSAQKSHNHSLKAKGNLEALRKHSSDPVLQDMRSLPFDRITVTLNISYLKKELHNVGKFLPHGEILGLQRDQTSFAGVGHCRLLEDPEFLKFTTVIIPFPTSKFCSLLSLHCQDPLASSTSGGWKDHENVSLCSAPLCELCFLTWKHDLTACIWHICLILDSDINLSYMVLHPDPYYCSCLRRLLLLRCDFQIEVNQARLLTTSLI